MWLQFLLVALIALVGSVSCLPESLVLNGTATDFRKFPHIVSIRLRGYTFCGGSLISSEWILTAAHCVDGYLPNQIDVVYGSDTVNALSTNVVGVNRIVKHEKFWFFKDYDIAVLKLTRPITLNNKTTASVTLPDQSFELPQTKEGAPGVLVYWDINATGGYKQSVLQEADMKIYSDKACKLNYFLKTPRQFCARDEGGKGPCVDDSGSALIYNNSLLGIQFLKPGCALVHSPGVFTKVAQFVDWINEETNFLN